MHKYLWSAGMVKKCSPLLLDALHHFAQQYMCAITAVSSLHLRVSAARSQSASAAIVCSE